MKLLITGATGGIGYATTLLALAQGHQVLAHGRNPHALAELSNAGAEIIQGDLRKPDDLAHLASTLEPTGLDAVIATQGISGGGTLRDFPLERVRDVMEVNFNSVVQLYDVLRPLLRKSSGRYVVVASQASLRPEPFNSVYCASKWAVLAWAEAQSEIEEPYGIAIRALCPGRTVTPLFNDAMEEFATAAEEPLDEYTDEILRLIPLRRFAAVKETAGSALFLAAAENRPKVLAQTGGEVPY